MGMSRARVAVLQVVSKQLSITEAAAEYGFSRRHLHRLLVRYRQGGLERLSLAHAVPVPARRQRLRWFVSGLPSCVGS